MDGVNAGALGLMLAVCVSLGLASLTSATGWLIFGLAVSVLVVWNLNAAWIILVTGYFVTSLRAFFSEAIL
ncbi:hypothetical protein L0337_02505 [candidate division KSB1 bacterium]|nr:hypothetical protein [candidate division KSB1 bacterium]